MSDYGSTPPPPPPPPPPPSPPGPYGASGALGTPPPNYLVWAILATVLCGCSSIITLPLGIASIVFSTQVNSKWALGDVAGAQEASAKAKKFAIWAVIGWGIFLVLYVIALIVGVGSLNFSTGTNSGF